MRLFVLGVKFVIAAAFAFGGKVLSYEVTRGENAEDVYPPLADLLDTSGLLMHVAGMCFVAWLAIRILGELIPSSATDLIDIKIGEDKKPTQENTSEK